MLILGLDLSTSAGWAILNDGSPVAFGLVQIPDANNYEHVPDYAQIDRAESVSAKIRAMILANKVDYIYIEQTNAGSFRTSQRQLEFIHYAILKMLRDEGLADKVRYVDTSAWRRKLGIKLDKTQREHNKRVSKKLAKGKITWKHLAVNWVNEKFGLDFLLKDNDIADAIAVAFYGNIQSEKAKPLAKDLTSIF